MRTPLAILTITCALLLTACGDGRDAPKATASNDAKTTPVQGAELGVAPQKKPDEATDKPTETTDTDAPEQTEPTTVAKADTPEDIAAKQKANAEAFLDKKRKKSETSDTTASAASPTEADKKSRYESDPLILNPDDPNANVRPEDLPSLQAPTVEGYRNVDFDLLSGYEYIVDEMIPDEEAIAEAAKDPDAEPLVVPEQRGDAQIPDKVKQLDGKKIAIAGYMVPVTYREGKTNEFVLIKVVPSCFFCTQPGINDWIEIKTGDNWVPYMGDEPLFVTGVLHVGAIKEDGFTLSLYRLDAHGVEPLKLEAK